jgi:hypothetical protein
VSPLLRICSAPGCTTLVQMGRKLCAEHARIDSTKRNQRTRRDGRNTTQWMKTRAFVIARANHHCELQLPGCTTIATTAHKQGGGYHTPNPDDYQASCRHCHGVVDGGRRPRTIVA